MNDKSKSAEYYKTKYKQELAKLLLILSGTALFAMIALASQFVYRFVSSQEFFSSPQFAKMLREIFKAQQAQTELFAEILATLSGVVAWATTIAGGMLIWARIVNGVIRLRGFEIRRIPRRNPEHGTKEMNQKGNS
jgi:DNA-binding transcriptional MocR family regulator